MRIFLFFLGLPGTTESAGQTYRDIIDEAVLAEELGYAGVWIAEHHFTPNYAIVPNPLLLATAIAEHTHRLRIGAGCVVLPLHNPVRVAEDIAMLDALSNGRVELALCRGDHDWEYSALQVPLADSVANYRAALTRLKNLLLERECIGNQVPLTPAVVQRPTPPLWMTCGSPGSISMALDESMHVAISAGAGPLERLIALRDAFAQQFATRVLGPEKPRLGLLCHASLAGDADTLNNSLEVVEFLNRVVLRMKTGANSLLDRESNTFQVSREAFLEANLVGDADHVGRQLAKYQAMGFTDLFLMFSRGRATTSAIRHAMRTLAPLLACTP